MKRRFFEKRYKVWNWSFSGFEWMLIFGALYYFLFMSPKSILYFLMLVFAVVIHEVAHGVSAYYLGDPTAKQQGRLTLNPLAHIDPLGSVVLPGILLMTGSSFLIGWAKPVPVQPHYFKDPARGMMWVALAGPISNLIVATGCAVLIRLLWLANIRDLLYGMFVLDVLVYAIMLNVVLAVFNMIPIPPLDGSRVLAFFLPTSARSVFYQIEPYGTILIFLILIFNGFDFLFKWVVPFFISLFL